jgi:hypothetical protein
MNPHQVTPCPYAMRDTLYSTCPRDVHGYDGERCPDCPVRAALDHLKTIYARWNGDPSWENHMALKRALRSVGSVV